VEQCAKNPRPCCKYARHLGILHNKEGAQTIIIISDNEACGIDSELCVSRRLCALHVRASAAARRTSSRISSKDDNIAL
jgi:hypothetical protein